MRQDTKGRDHKLAAVSIIIPARDAAASIAATLVSLQRQTCGDWEAIVVDDGSTDRTGEIVRQFAGGDSRIRLGSGRGAGPAAARNVALGEARAEWVVFLDADDTLPSHRLERMLQAVAARDDLILAYSGWQRMSAEGELLSDHPPPPTGELFEITARCCPFAIHAAMTRRTALLQEGGFEESLLICEDWDLWQRLARRAPAAEALVNERVQVVTRRGSLSSRRAEFLRSGFKVIARGFGRDERVASPAAQWISGVSTDDVAQAQTMLRYWLVGAAIGDGQDIADILIADPSATTAPVDIFAAGSTFLDGVGAGAALPLSRWREIEDRLEPSLSTFRDWLDGESPKAQMGSRFGYALEQRCSTQLPVGIDARIGRLQIRSVDLSKRLEAIVPADGAERLLCRVSVGNLPIGDIETLALGPVSAADLKAAILDELDQDRLLSAFFAAKLVRPARWFRQLFQDSRAANGAVIASRGLWPIQSIIAAKKAYSDPPEPAPDFSLALGESGTRAASAIIKQEAGRFALPEKASAEGDAIWQPPDYASQSYWEGVFAERDPWNYENSYEAVKYDQTLGALPPGAIGRALELACAEGHFTRMLAPRVAELLATDISVAAIERAAERCKDRENATFRQLDLLTDDIPGPFDLIVCSEVLYYLPDGAALTAIADKFADALTEGGALVVAHGNLLVDEPNATGFPWPHQFGAKGIGDVFAAQPALELEYELWTPLYRVQRFRKSTVATSFKREIANAAPRLPHRVASQVRWRGGSEIEVADRWHDFPILMYHRIADDGPDALAPYRTSPNSFEAQLKLLAESGWRGVTLDRLYRAVLNREALPPRSVFLSFDDAYTDFVEAALPLLHRYGFPATLFVPVGKLGGKSDWDEVAGQPASLLNADDIQRVAFCDVAIGSHGRSHASLPGLSAEDQVGELAGSRLQIGGIVGREVAAIAYPFGDYTPALRRAAGGSGYWIGLTCDHGWVTASAAPLVLPRIEVRGDYSLDRFGQMLGIS